MKNIIIAIIVILGVLAAGSLFVVQEGTRAIVIQFGKVQKDSATGETKVFAPGLYFKVPFIDTVRSLDARVQTLDDAPDRFVTSEKKDLIVDSYVKWRIDDFEQAALDLRPWWLKVDYVNQHMSLDNKSSNAPPKS